MFSLFYELYQAARRRENNIIILIIILCDTFILITNVLRIFLQKIHTAILRIKSFSSLLAPRHASAAAGTEWMASTDGRDAPAPSIWAKVAAAARPGGAAPQSCAVGARFWI